MIFLEKNALITGAGSGIGRATALAFAAGGARVTVTDIDLDAAQETARLVELAGGTALALHCDARKAEDQQQAVHAAVTRFGSLQVACNNAGVTGVTGTDPCLAADIPLATWQCVLDVNLSGVLYGLRAQIPALLAAGGGSIVNVASILGQVASRGAAAYVASKHGVVGLTRAAALDYADRNIRINSVGPGYTDTPMLHGKDTAALGALEARHPMKRLGRAEEIAALIVWLCSPGASFVTGAYYPADGGYLAQ